MSERHSIEVFTMREKYSDLHEALRVRDDECMKG